MEKFNDLQLIKRQFFAMRNGVIADTLRRNGSPFRIIFGLVLPQIDEIAKATGYNRDLATRLWANTTTRESMLIAPMLIDPATFTSAEALQWIATAVGVEPIDILCHRLLRKLPDAYELALTALQSSENLIRYAGLRLMWQFISTHTAEARHAAQSELRTGNPLTRFLANQIIEEIEFLSETEA